MYILWSSIFLQLKHGSLILFSVYTDYEDIQGKRTCWNWVHSRLPSMLSDWKSKWLFHFYYIAQEQLRSCILNLYICRLGLFLWMMTLGKKLLHNLKLQWRPTRHSTLILMDVTSLRGWVKFVCCLSIINYVDCWLYQLCWPYIMVNYSNCGLETLIYLEEQDTI